MCLKCDFKALSVATGQHIIRAQCTVAGMTAEEFEESLYNSYKYKAYVANVQEFLEFLRIESDKEAIQLEIDDMTDT